MSKMQKALEALLYRIAQGREYPDVIGTIAEKYGVNHDRLARAYDVWFDEGGELPEIPDDTPALPEPPWAYK